VKNFILHANDAGKEFITFKSTRITGFPKSISSAPFSLTIVGDLTIAGVTKQVVFQAASVTVTEQQVEGVAKATIKRSDYGLIIPSIPFVANVSDTFTVSLDVAAVR
jgi:polyisoprenoid-binding protein YceI